MATLRFVLKTRRSLLSASPVVRHLITCDVSQWISRAPLSDHAFCVPLECQKKKKKSAESPAEMRLFLFEADTFAWVASAALERAQVVSRGRTLQRRDKVQQDNKEAAETARKTKSPHFFTQNTPSEFSNPKVFCKVPLDGNFCLPLTFSNHHDWDHCWRYCYHFPIVSTRKR